MSEKYTNLLRKQLFAKILKELMSKNNPKYYCIIIDRVEKAHFSSTKTYTLSEVPLKIFQANLWSPRVAFITPQIYSLALNFRYTPHIVSFTSSANMTVI